MGRNILILNGHPDPESKGLCHALADAYAEGASEGGHTVRRLDVAKLHVDFLRSQTEFEKGVPRPEIAAVQGSILWANHMVVIFPLWLQTVMGYTAGIAGLATAPVGLLALVLSPLIGRNMHRLDLRLVASLAFLVFAFVGTEPSVAGCASTAFSATVELAQYWRPMSPLRSPARSRMRNGGKPPFAAGSSRRASRRSENSASSASATFT